jgi:hypothetical protein
MWIIDRQLKQVRALGADERALLVGFAVGALESKEEQQASDLLRKIRTANQWLECDCTQIVSMTGHGVSPVLHVALMDDSRVVVRNNPEGALHLSDCPFSHDSISERTGSRSVSHTVSRLGEEAVVALHSEFRPPRQGPAQQNSRRNEPAEPKVKSKHLVSLLLTLIERADLHVYRPATKRSLTDQFAALKAAATAFTLAPGVALGNVLSTNINNQALVKMSMNLRVSDAFGESRRVGLLLDGVAKVSGHTITTATGQAIDYFGRTERSVPSSFPALALASVTTEKAGDRFYKVGNVAFIPTLSGSNFFPCVGDLDRVCSSEIMKLVDWFYSVKKIEINVFRHLFAADGGSLLVLRSNRLTLHLDFSRLPLAPDQAVEGPRTLRLSDFDTFESLKKAIILEVYKAH